VESLRPGLVRELRWRNRAYACTTWVERLEADASASVLGSFASGDPAIVEKAGRTYVAAWPTRELALDLVSHALHTAGIATTRLDEDIRLRRRDGITFAFNFSGDSRPAPAPAGATYVLGAQSIAPFNLSAWKS
jgi:beta-galactosidase